MQRKHVGFAWMVVSAVLWGGALACPFLDAEVSTRAALGVGLYALSYVAFGLGAAALGRDVMARFDLRARWRAWRDRSDADRGR